MLVFSRRKNEAILIDGAIEIEVVNVTKATVRVRLSAPRCMQVVRGFVKKELGAELEPANKANPVGIDTLNLTLVSQQVIELGTSISLGIVDVDRSRALFFIDAPPGTSVLAADQRAACCQNPTARQNLLQFMSPPSERGGTGLEKTADNDPSRDRREGGAGDPGPLVLPFPSQPASGDPDQDAAASRSGCSTPTNVKPCLP
jgi:carbon storage regulator CsrA